MAIVCGRRRFDETVPSAVVNPVAVFEVLSPSSEGYDTGDKFDFYAQLVTLRDYILISQRRQRVEVRSRGSVKDDCKTTV